MGLGSNKETMGEGPHKLGLGWGVGALLLVVHEHHISKTTPLPPSPPKKTPVSCRPGAINPVGMERSHSRP